MSSKPANDLNYIALFVNSQFSLWDEYSYHDSLQARIELAIVCGNKGELGMAYFSGNSKMITATDVAER